MKAAVLHNFGDIPGYEDFPDPIPTADEIVIQVKAVALENVDKVLAQGSHYSSQKFYPHLPAIVAFDGIGVLEDGQLVGFGGIRPPYGAMAEKVVIRKAYHVPIPEGIDVAIAASVPGSTLASLFALKCAANFQPGETVLINGATGFAGMLGVQAAKLLGAGRVIGTGRDSTALENLLQLGADAVIDLKQSDEKVIDAFKTQGGESGYQVILDYLWGHPTDLLIQSLVPHDLLFAKHPTRLVQIGEMAGPNIPLPANALRTSGLEIVGASSGVTAETVGEGTMLVWEWIKSGQLHFSIERVPLSEVESAWKRSDNLHGKRIVILP